MLVLRMDPDDFTTEERRYLQIQIQKLSSIYGLDAVIATAWAYLLQEAEETGEDLVSEILLDLLRPPE